MSGILTISRSDKGREGRDEGDSRALYPAVADAPHIYQYRNLQENLRKLGWKQARKRVLTHGGPSNE